MRQVTALQNDLAREAYEKDGRRHAMGKASKYMGYKSLREEPNLAVNRILNGRDVFVTGSSRTREGYGVCVHAGHMIKCVTSLNTSNSTKTQNVDMTYQTFFFPSFKLRP